MALYLTNSVEYLESMYGAIKAGLVPVNTNYRYADDELAYLWDNADAVGVVFHGSFAERAERVRTRVPGVRGWLWVDDGSGPCPDWAVPYEEWAKCSTGRVPGTLGPQRRRPDHALHRREPPGCPRASCGARTTCSPA